LLILTKANVAEREIMYVHAVVWAIGLAGAVTIGLVSPSTAADDGPVYGPQLQGFDYPWPVSNFSFASQRETVDMAYMDVKAPAPNGKTAVLLHGKNFCAATWQQTISF
jgi:hypothetical protein